MTDMTAKNNSNLAVNTRNGQLNDILIADFMREQLKSDISQCLTCVYNRKEIDDYFEPMLRI